MSPSTDPRPDSHPAAASARVLAVVGPTAVGKTALAEELAVRLGGEIVSADSMQVYRGMDIGTAKPPAEERQVAYHCIDVAELGETFSAARYQPLARAAITDIAGRGSLPIVCGGTGLYMRAALDDMRFAPPGDPAAHGRRRYEQLAGAEGAAALHALLAERDPGAAALLHPNNVRRVVRALEMLDEGVSYADQHSGFADRRSVFDARFLGLTMDRPLLYERVEARVDAMLAAGLLDEVRALVDAGLADALTAMQAIGYKELVPVVRGQAELAGAVAEIKTSSRRYAKRQLSWFRADPRVRWIDVTEMTTAESALAALGTLDW